MGIGEGTQRMIGGEPSIAIAWSGLPFYGARLIRAGIESLGEPVTVIGTRPKVPIAGIEESLGQPVHWIEDHEPVNWARFGIPPPRVFLHTGWRFRAFNSLGLEVRRSGGRVVSMIDNSRKNSIRQWFGAAVFRLIYRRWFWGVWVPGKSGERLCVFLGAPRGKIYHGLYGADPAVFSGAEVAPRAQRKCFLFAGQLIERKGVWELLGAFSKLKSVHPDAELIVAGSGPLERACRAVDGVRVTGFVQPSELSLLLREARCLVLPSHEEHWGLVVHEAALSGCALLLSDAVGAADDLLGRNNGIRFHGRSDAALYSAMETIVLWGEERLETAGCESRRLASGFGPERWAQTFVKIVNDVRKGHCAS